MAMISGKNNVCEITRVFDCEKNLGTYTVPALIRVTDGSYCGVIRLITDNREKAKYIREGNHITVFEFDFGIGGLKMFSSCWECGVVSDSEPVKVCKEHKSTIEFHCGYCGESFTLGDIVDACKYRYCPSCGKPIDGRYKSTIL